MNLSLVPVICTYIQHFLFLSFSPSPSSCSFSSSKPTSIQIGQVKMNGHPEETPEGPVMADSFYLLLHWKNGALQLFYFKLNYPERFSIFASWFEKMLKLISADPTVGSRVLIRKHCGRGSIGVAHLHKHFYWRGMCRITRFNWTDRLILIAPPPSKKNRLAKPQNLHISKNRFDGGRGIIYDRIGGLNQLDILFLKKKTADSRRTHRPRPL